ncbi:hypothetical protein Cgig2_030435 [Carnegiea gigantea]|uniref:Glycoside hydrolase family 3 N-terminal domain-containing protein n=1 Tax=Carnegiea gigantea TaxID=171969 RepID=A0A9Q1KQQ6_9CARY|nr:hypothetical protein Cgig2_030435 [Carnegiea gigantea]
MLCMGIITSMIQQRSPIMLVLVLPGRRLSRSLLCIDLNLVKRIDAATTLEVRTTGIQYTLLLTLHCSKKKRLLNPRWGHCHQSYSEDHEIVQQMTYTIYGLLGDDPPHKGIPYVAGKGINDDSTVTDMHGLLSIHMPIYSIMIVKGVSMLMISYLTWNGVEIYANRRLVAYFLKNTLKFKGFVISNEQGTMPPNVNHACVVLTGIPVGIGRVMVPYNFNEFIDDLDCLSKNNHIPMDCIDDAMLRILMRTEFSLATLLFGDRSGTTILNTTDSAVDQSTKVFYQENPYGDFVKSNNFAYAIFVVGEPTYAETGGGNETLTLADPGPIVINNVYRAINVLSLSYLVVLLSLSDILLRLMPW